MNDRDLCTNNKGVEEKSAVSVHRTNNLTIFRDYLVLETSAQSGCTVVR